MARPTLTISEFAARAGVTASALRFWERRGLIASVRTSGNQRRFARDQLRRVAFIRSAQTVGLSLTEITAALATLPPGRAPSPHDWTTLSRRWLDRIDHRIALLQALRDDLADCIGCGCLSFDKCALYNEEDRLGADGPGARLLP
ncbi:redox-sensitive transcriptional activator SoxR [Stackebrandtia soli]|uniref:redox-sensitive transcriptional activator SoxR n=1 Tax=Stackebrandtia soli TaxID=1892856 RepID=UPI0039ECC032